MGEMGDRALNQQGFPPPHSTVTSEKSLSIPELFPYLQKQIC